MQGACRGPTINEIPQISVLPSYCFCMKNVFFLAGARIKPTLLQGREKKKQLNKCSNGHFCCRKARGLAYREWTSLFQLSFLPASVPMVPGRPPLGPQNPPGAVCAVCHAAAGAPKLSAAKMKNLRLAVRALQAQEGFGGMQAGVT